MRSLGLCSSSLRIHSIFFRLPAILSSIISFSPVILVIKKALPIKKKCLFDINIMPHINIRHNINIQFANLNRPTLIPMKDI